MLTRGKLPALPIPVRRSARRSPPQGLAQPLLPLVPLLPAILLISLIAGCASSKTYEPFDSVDHLRGQYDERLGAESAAAVEVPFLLDDRVREIIDTTLARGGGEEWRIEQALDFIFHQLDLEYSQNPTRSAVQTFWAREGNCLSFVNLFVGVTREMRLNPFYVEVEDYQKWYYQDGTVVSHGHIVAGMYVNGKLRTYDFLPYRPKSYRKFQPISDVKATAHYYNNLGAEALFEGDLERAHELLSVAVALVPDFDKALNNLGVTLQRLGRLDEALAVYQQGIGFDPDNVPLLTNLARLHQGLGQEAEALAYLDKIETLEHTNPFFFVYRGELALSQGDTQSALEYMVTALRRDNGLPEVHLGLLKVYLALGDMERVRFHLERALRLDATNREARKYALMLSGGRTSDAESQR